MNLRKSFSTKLSLNILAVTSVVFILAIGAAAISSHILISDEATKSVEHLLDATIGEIEKTLQNVEFAVEASSWLVAENKQNDDYLYHITEKIVSENSNIVGSAIAFVDNFKKGRHFFSPYSYVDQATGEVLSKQLGTEDYDYFTMEWFAKPFATGEVNWSEPYVDEGGGEYLMCTYSYPIKDEEGNVYAVMTADITLDWIQGVLEDIKPYVHSVVSLMSHQGRYIKAQTNEKYGESIYSTMNVTEGEGHNIDSLVSAIMSGRKGHMQYFAQGHLCFAVYGPLKNGWYASIATDYQDVLERSSIMRNLLTIIGLIGLIILFLISFYTIRKLTGPLSKFSVAAEEVAKGNFNYALPEIETEDEVGQLHDSFEQMQNSLTEYIENLKATTATNERLESELNIASKIQMAMLPKDFPNEEGLDIHAVLKPAKEVGGDLYDFYVRDGILHFTVGDVSGKGMPAAMIMAITRSAFRFISRLGLKPGEIVSKMNDSICDGNDSNMFVTLFVGEIELATGKFTFCNAGHNPIIVDGSYMNVKPNLAVGLFEGFPYQQQTVQLSNDSSIIIYTDGITEAERADKAQFGEQALIDCARTTAGLTAEEACGAILSKVHGFTAGNPQNDDITLMTIKINR